MNAQKQKKRSIPVTNQKGVEKMFDRRVYNFAAGPAAMPEEVLSNVMDGINAFVAGTQQFDDITMMCMKYNG